MIENVFLFRRDTPNELKLVRDAAIAAGADDAVICNHWEEGGLGAIDLADAVIKAVEKPNDFKFLYNLNDEIEDKVSVIAREMYGAGNVVFHEKVSIISRKV